MTANPTLLSMPLAQNGQKNVIPETQATPGNGLFSQSTGFPAETALPLGAGGVAPSREDFNGIANLLGGVAFMVQKGFTFNYDATQDYYSGCVVIDSSDGKRYECIADMAAGTIAPHDDSANTYWTIFKSGLDREQIPAFNHRDVITTSGTYTAPVDGWYCITVKGGGGGGSGGKYNDGTGGGGGEGGTTSAFEYMELGDTATVIIGGGGTGGTAGGTSGADGGDSSVSVNSNTYTGGGGKGAVWDSGNASSCGGAGGSGTIYGAPGCAGVRGPGNSNTGSSGGGAGGGASAHRASATNGVNGGGGSGGGASSGSGQQWAGGNGGDGYAWFEYFAEV